MPRCYVVRGLPASKERAAPRDRKTRVVPLVRNAMRFVCKSCSAKRDVTLACDPADLEVYGSFIRCPACMKTDRGNTALYWAFFVLKVFGMSAIMALVAVLTTPYLYVLVPMGIVALWADHLRFCRKLDVAFTGGRVSGGPAHELLARW